LRYYPSIYLKELKKTKKNPSRDSRCSCRDSSGAFSDYK
jgi:hypothetical protein